MQIELKMRSQDRIVGLRGFVEQDASVLHRRRTSVCISTKEGGAPSCACI